MSRLWWQQCCTVQKYVHWQSMKTLEAAHNKFQRRLLGIKWYDTVSNAEVGKRTGMAKIVEIIKERRLRWLWHVIRMEDCRIPNQAFKWNLSIMNRKPGRPRKNWQDIIRRDLKDTGLSWDEASELAHPRSSWRQRVAQCVFDAAWTQISGLRV